MIEELGTLLVLLLLSSPRKASGTRKCQEKRQKKGESHFLWRGVKQKKGVFVCVIAQKNLKSLSANHTTFERQAPSVRKRNQTFASKNSTKENPRPGMWTFGHCTKKLKFSLFFFVQLFSCSSSAMYKNLIRNRFILNRSKPREGDFWNRKRTVFCFSFPMNSNGWHFTGYHKSRNVETFAQLFFPKCIMPLPLLGSFKFDGCGLFFSTSLRHASSFKNGARERRKTARDSEMF